MTNIKQRKSIQIIEGKRIKIREEGKEKKPDKANDKFYSVFSMAWDLGFSISLPIVGGAVLGQFLDKYFGTLPRITLSLIFIGIILGCTNIYFILKKINKD